MRLGRAATGIPLSRDRPQGGHRHRGCRRCKGEKGSGHTQLLPDLGRPDDAVELDFGDAERALVDELDGVVLEGVVPVSEQDAL